MDNPTVLPCTDSFYLEWAKYKFRDISNNKEVLFDVYGRPYTLIYKIDRMYLQENQETLFWINNFFVNEARQLIGDFVVAQDVGVGGNLTLKVVSKKSLLDDMYGYR